MVAGNPTQRQEPGDRDRDHGSARPAPAPRQITPSLPDSDEIVISGISGRFPESANMNEFMDNLLNHVNMVTANERRFKPGLYGVPKGFGTLKEIDKFDADAFGMLPGQVNKTDPQLRMTLETVYEAMCDAGVNPTDQRGSNTGVFLGLCTSESMTLLSEEPNRIDGLALIGCSNSMFANRVSFSFDFKGPSCAYDTACSTSIFALEAAVSAMRAGKCDAAIVTASTLILTPTVNIQFNKLGMLAKDSTCKSFDKTGDGFARAETVATIYLQRASVARRAYATVVHIKTNTDGYKDAGITYPSAEMQEKLLRDVYREARVNRDEISYVEAHGTGTSVGDPQEITAISKIFRSRGLINPARHPPLVPLLIGSVKSNVGHAEGASGLCSIAKVVVMIQTGVIPANLHYNEPPFALNFVRNGVIKVVDENTEFHGGLIAVNSFGFGGVNTHFVLKPFKKKADLTRNSVLQLHHRPVPQLITFAGRNQAGVEDALRKITESEDHNLFLLINELNKTPNPSTIVRGFSVWKPAPSAFVPPNTVRVSPPPEDASEILQALPASSAPPQLWFVFNGIGSQWPGMCRDLLRNQIFAKSVAASATTLKTRFNFDLYALLNAGINNRGTGDETVAAIFDNPTNCFVCIAACQIGLVDILRAIGIRPAGFLGHSAGEMVCAYVDECLTAEETIICAYLRGSSLSLEGVDPGAMAVVSMTWAQVEKMCPPGSGVYAACHNAIDSVTVSGTRAAIESFVQQLKDKKKGVKKVNSCGVAFHSPCIAKASVKFLADLRSAFKKRADKTRSSSWISTSIPEVEWNSDLASTASPEYFVNNFLSPVLFYEALAHVPQNATVLEIGASGLLRGLIKKTCPTATVIPLQSRDSKQGLVELLTALGKLYVAGVNLDVNKLTNANAATAMTSHFPVPVGTPFISPLVAGVWDHSTSWCVPYFGMNGERQITRFEIDLSSESDSFLTGHMAQGRILFPATGYLFLVWKHFAQSQQLHYEQCPIVLENVRLHRVTVLNARSPIEFRIHISEVTGTFEVKEGGAVVASGVIRLPDSNPAVVETKIDDRTFEEIEVHEKKKLATESELAKLEGRHIYKRFRFYGFEYDSLFKGIRTSWNDFQSFTVAWHGNWIAFLDTFLQTCIEPYDRSNFVKLPTAITKIVVNPQQFLNSFPEAHTKDPEVFVYKDKNLSLIKCRGVEFHGPQTTTIGRSSGKEVRPVLFSAGFTPYFDQEPDLVEEVANNKSSAPSPMIQCVSIVMENLASRFTSTPTQPSAMAPVTVVELDSTDGASSSGGDQLESIEVDKLIRLNFGVLDLNYTIFTTQHGSDEFQARFTGSRIQLKGYDSFQKESWLDKSYDLIILHNHRMLMFACQYMRKGTFMLLKMARGPGAGCLRPSEVEDKIGPKLSLVSVKYAPSGSNVVYLIRKNTKQNDVPTTIVVSSRETSWVSELQVAITQQEEIRDLPNINGCRPSRIYLLANDAGEGGGSDSGIRGLFNCLRKEPFSQQFRMILNKCPGTTLDFKNPSPELALALKHDLAINILDETGRWGFYSACNRLESKNPSRKVSSAFVGMRNIGDLSTFRWIEGHDFKMLTLSMSSGFVPVDVHFAALNFKDIMLATGNLPTPDPSPSAPFTVESPLGLEFSGVDQAGVRVCGYVESQAMATQVLGFVPQLWRIPSHWTFADAATVPVVYATAYMALILRGQLQPGESVLIHSGAGGVGQAAIRIALSKGCTVYTTVGSADKREFLRQQFPDSLPDSHVGNSRDTSFENMIMTRTRGRGVDVVLNSLSGDKLEASVRCLSRHGRFLEIGKFDLVANKSLGMALFLKNASFHGVMLDSLWDANPSVLEQLHTLLQEGIDSGVVQPLPYRVFQREQVEPAFRYMGTGKHVGKILIQVRKEEASPPKPLELDAHPRVYFNPTASYIIVGGLGGIGLEFINWMIARGARHILISSRSGVTTSYQAGYLKAWRRRNDVDIQISTLDASRLENAKALLDQAAAMGRPVDGFFNLAARLELAFMKDQTEESFRAAMYPKVVLTRNMDQITRERWPEMSHFVVFSSIVAGIGLPGQCAYGLANAGCEEICEQRARDGLAGKAVELGPISDVGVFHEMHQQELSSYAGTGTQNVSSVLKCLDILLTAHEPVVISRVNRELTASNSSTTGGGCLTITDRIGHILGTDISRLNPKTKLTELGLDSIMSMELKQVLEQDYALSLSATEIRTVTLEQLLEMSKNSEKNKLGGGGGGNGALAAHTRRGRAATADLFQFDFMRNAKKTKILYPQCVHPLNKVTDRSQGTVFICNSVEGPEILRILGNLVRRPAYSMQFPQDAPLHDLDAMADYYLKELRAAEPQGPYVIAGYSAGTFMAIELALRLQTTNDVTKLVLIDLTPGRADAILEENFGPDRNQLDETSLMVVTLSQVLNIDRGHLEAIVSSLPDRESRIQKAVELGSAFFDDKVDAKIFERLLGDSQIQIINLFNRYKPREMYEGKVVLVRTTQNLISYDSTEYWGLEEFCTRTPIVRTVESTHSYIVAEPGVHEVAAAINND